MLQQCWIINKIVQIFANSAKIFAIFVCKQVEQKKDSAEIWTLLLSLSKLLTTSKSPCYWNNLVKDIFDGCRTSSRRDFKPNGKIRDFKPKIFSLSHEIRLIWKSFWKISQFHDLNSVIISVFTKFKPPNDV